MMDQVDLMSSSLLPMNLNTDYPVIVRAEGRHLYAADGRVYLDGASGGVGAVNIGHAVPEVLAAIAEQSQKVCHANASLFMNAAALELAELIVQEFAPEQMNKVYFVSTGTEATELCVKFARVYHLYQGHPERSKIISRWSGYHGSSLAALSFSGRTSRRTDFQPYYFPSIRIRPAYHFRDGRGMSEEAYAQVCARDLEDAIVREVPETVSCFIAEPFVNTMGACPAPADYFELVREICDRYGVLMISDEVVTGYGRTGQRFGIDHWNTVPDLIACGKGLSGGYSPIACAIVHDKIWDVLKSHPSGNTVAGYTHAANPLSAATAKAVLRYIFDHDLVTRSAQIGEHLQGLLRHRLGDHPHVGDIRGRGCHMALEFVTDRDSLGCYPENVNKAGEVYTACMAEGLNLCPVHGDADGLRGDSIIVKPAFTFTDAELDELVDKLVAGIERVRWQVDS